MKKLFIFAGIIVAILVFSVFAYGGLKYGYQQYRQNIVVVPPSSGSPSFPPSVNLENKDEVVSALRGLDTSKSYDWVGTTTAVGKNGLVKTPSPKTFATSPFVKLAINGSRGPVALQAPAKLTIQLWIDPASQFTNCRESEYSFTGLMNSKGDGGTGDKFSSFFYPTIKTGELVSGVIDNVPPGLYRFGVGCDSGYSGGYSFVRVYVHK